MGKFVVKETKDGGLVFNLKAGNGQVIATSETYKSEKSCLSGIESVRKNCMAEIEDQTAAEPVTLKNPKYEIYRDKKGEYRFRLKAANGEIIATGEGYAAKASCLKGIRSIQANAPEAEIVK